MKKKHIGRIGWIDLTVGHAPALKEFYEQVVGWETAAVDAGGYDDFALCVPGEAAPLAGICHARGDNANLPPQWLVYVNVESVNASLEKVRALGGVVIDGPRKLGGRDFACIRDPAGAYLGIIEADES